MGSSCPSMEAGTWDSQESSSEVRVDARDEYHEPAWLATRVVIIIDSFKIFDENWSVERLCGYRGGYQFRSWSVC